MIKTNGGLTIKLIGQAEKILKNVPLSNVHCIKPSDFIYITPKLLVSEKEYVKAGTPLFMDKFNNDIKFVSPVSGEIVEIKRGEKRTIESIKILRDKEITYEKFEVPSLNNLNSESVKKLLLDSGLWPLIRQRPYSSIANPNDTPKAIFISCFDTSPLSTDRDFQVNNMYNELQAGIDALKFLTKGQINVNISTQTFSQNDIEKLKGVVFNRFEYKHPAGNVGYQINKLNPINKGETVWYLYPDELVIIGKFFIKGITDFTKIVSVSGPNLVEPKYYRTIIGSQIKGVIENNLNDSSNSRIISGNVLTGTKIDKEGFLGYYDNLISVISEKVEDEFLGWLLPNNNKFSYSGTFLSKFFPKKFNLNANQNGEERPFVISGSYDKVMAMDILPVYLIKSILAEDIENMENLGIFELSEEDIALCELICPSKIEFQKILRRGIDMIRQEYIVSHH